MFNGIVLGMKGMGATLVKVDKTHLFFDIKIGSDIDDKEKLERVRDLVQTEFGLGIKIKKI